jgi:hypothetical protein
MPSSLLEFVCASANRAKLVVAMATTGRMAALLVSHWAVASDATVRLITGAVGRMASDKGIGRAEAMSMLALIDKGETYEAHPAYWAPCRRRRGRSCGRGFGRDLGKEICACTGFPGIPAASATIERGFGVRDHGLLFWRQEIPTGYSDNASARRGLGLKAGWRQPRVLDPDGLVRIGSDPVGQHPSQQHAERARVGLERIAPERRPPQTLP